MARPSVSTDSVRSVSIVEAALNGDLGANYGLTAQGGAAWEAVACPDWNRYIDECYGDTDSAGELQPQLRGEQCVRVIAGGVNPADPLTLGGKYAQEWGTHLPLIPGYEIAGIVEKTGAQVTTLKKGDAVYGYPNFGGGWAEYVAVKEWEVAPKPRSLTFAEAAAVPMGALTAWQALVKVAHLQSGQTVLIHGGSGGVGSFAIQIAKAQGARVFATAEVAIDYTKTKFEDVAKDVDAVLDSVGRETLARSYGVVKKGGIVLDLVGRPDPVELGKHRIRGAAIWVRPDAKDLAEIAQLIDAGKIKPVVTQVLPLSEAIAAERQAETHHTRGKIVLRIADEPKG